MGLSRSLTAAAMAALLAFSPLAASAQALGSGVAADNVWSFTPAPFPGVGVPSSPLTSYSSNNPQPPNPPSYNGEWVYTSTGQIDWSLPGNGFAWFIYAKTCINGTCDPATEPAQATCPVDGFCYFSGSNSAFCPRRAIC